MLTIRTLDEFCVTNGIAEINQSDIKSLKMVELFMFLVINRKGSINNEKIARELWNREESDNPSGALKNLIYRLRKSLDNNFGKYDYIIIKDGSYAWNEKAALSIDIEQFDEIFNLALEEQTCSKEIDMLEKIVEIYQSDFMHGVIDAHWVISVRSYYHKLFFVAVKKLIDLYKRDSEFEKIEQLCAHVIEIDNSDEEIYYELVNAKVKLSKFDEAKSIYNSSKKMIENIVGVGNAKKLNQLYNLIVSINNGENIVNIEQIQNDIVERETQGVFLCGYQVFKEIYKLERRKSIRTEDAQNLILLTVEIDSDVSDEIYRIRKEKSMQALENTLIDCLRSGDVAARYSDFQYVILLSNCTGEVSQNVGERIIKNFYSKNEFLWNLKIKMESNAIDILYSNI